MPMDRKARRDLVKPAKVELDGQTLKFYYRPAYFDGNMLAASAAIEQGNHDLIYPQLVRLIDRWDLVDGDDPVPVTADEMRSLDIALLTSIIEEIAGDLRPGERNAGGSSIG